MEIYNSIFISNNHDIEVMSFINKEDAIKYSKDRFDDNDELNPEGTYDFELKNNDDCYYWNGESDGDHIFVVDGFLHEKVI